MKKQLYDITVMLVVEKLIMVCTMNHEIWFSVFGFSIMFVMAWKVRSKGFI